MKLERRVSEETICRLIGFDGFHCASCHEDSAMGYDMIYLSLGKGRYAEVCCAVAWAFEEWRHKQLPSFIYHSK